jgi:chromosome segregation ATPase
LVCLNKIYFHKKRWKNKVRKLEKSLERYKTEAEKLLDQNEALKSNQTGYTAQFENKNQECQTLRVEKL